MKTKNKIFLFADDSSFAPDWITDDVDELKAGIVDNLDEKEVEFWKSLLEQYLAPLKHDKDRELRIQAELMELKNTCALTIFVLNLFVVTIVFFLQINPDIYVTWMLKSDEKLTPVALVFVFLYVAILFLQISAMICHRLGTFMHIMSTTKLDLRCWKREVTDSGEDDLQQNGVIYVKQLQQLRGVDSESFDSAFEKKADDKLHYGDIGSRFKRQRQKTVRYEDAFIKRLDKLPDTEKIAPADSEHVRVSRDLTLRKQTAFAMSVRKRQSLKTRKQPPPAPPAQTPPPSSSSSR